MLVRILLYLAVYVGLWMLVRRRPPARLRVVLAAAWIGLLGSRIAPAFSSELLSRLGLPLGLAPLLGQIVVFSGSVFVIWAVFSLVNRNADETRRSTRVLRRMFLAGVVLGALPNVGGALFAFFFCAPLLFRVSWAQGLGAGHLLLASSTAILALLLSLVNLGGVATDGANPIVAAMASVAGISRILVALHSLACFFRLPGRVHLSIRSIARRLTASHLLAGVIPAALAVVFVLLAAAVQLSNYRGTIGKRFLSESVAQARSSVLTNLTARGEIPTSIFDDGHGEIVLRRDAGGAATVLRGAPRFSADALLARPESSQEIPLLWDGHTTFLRARIDTVIRGDSVRVEALAPLDARRLNALARIVGVPVKPHPTLRLQQSGGGVQIGSDEDDAYESDAASRDSLASLEEMDLEDLIALVPDSVKTEIDSLMLRDPAAAIRRSQTLRRDLEDALRDREAELRAARRSVALRDSIDKLTPQLPESLVTVQTGLSGWRIPGGAVIHCLRWRDDGFRVDRVPISTFAAFGETFASLVTSVRDNPIGFIALIAMAVIATLLLAAVYTTVSMVFGMVRQVTRTVGVLQDATRAIGAGKLDHRIKLEGKDELWTVAESLNQMAAGLQQMREMERENARLEDELRLARAIQDRLLPSSAPTVDHFDLAGTSLPARQVGGDYFDYLKLDNGLVGIAVADVSGKGAAAALLMSSFRASLHSLDVGALGPSEALSRLNRFVHSSVDPGKFITAFLGVLDPVTGDLVYSCAGHEPPIVLAPDGTVQQLTAGGLVLGLFPHAVYEEASVRMPTGALLAIFTDGVTEAQSPEGEFYGDERLIEALKRSAIGDCSRTVKEVVHGLQDFAGSSAQFDDITLVLARRT